MLVYFENSNSVGHLSARLLIIILLVALKLQTKVNGLTKNGIRIRPFVPSCLSASSCVDTMCFAYVINHFYIKGLKKKPSFLLFSFRIASFDYLILSAPFFVRTLLNNPMKISVLCEYLFVLIRKRHFKEFEIKRLS